MTYVGAPKRFLCHRSNKLCPGVVEKSVFHDRGAAHSLLAGRQRGIAAHTVSQSINIVIDRCLVESSPATRTGFIIRAAAAAATGVVPITDAAMSQTIDLAKSTQPQPQLAHPATS